MQLLGKWLLWILRVQNDRVRLKLRLTLCDCMLLSCRIQTGWITILFPQGDRMKEAISINKSLSALGDVISGKNVFSLDDLILTFYLKLTIISLCNSIIKSRKNYSLPKQ
jgi:hypothetical protein